MPVLRSQEQFIAAFLKLLELLALVLCVCLLKSSLVSLPVVVDFLICYVSLPQISITSVLTSLGRYFFFLLFVVVDSLFQLLTIPVLKTIYLFLEASLCTIKTHYFFFCSQWTWEYALLFHKNCLYTWRQLLSVPSVCKLNTCSLFIIIYRSLILSVALLFII